MFNTRSLAEKCVKHMSMRKRPRFVGLWLSDEGYAALQKRAENENTSVSGLLRRMLAYARNMPTGWRP